MSKNRNRAKLKKAKTGREYRILYLNELYPLYWDDGVNEYPKYKKGFKNPNKRIFSYQVRMYKTWKHNRKTRWKQ
jgi:hypothetical protein